LKEVCNTSFGCLIVYASFSVRIAVVFSYNRMTQNYEDLTHTKLAAILSNSCSFKATTSFPDDYTV